MQNDKNFLGTAPIGKLLLKLSIPTVIAQLINMLYNVVDRIYIGHIPGEGSLALTGVGVCMPIIMIVTALQHLSVPVVRQELLFVWENKIINPQNKYWETAFLYRLLFLLFLRWFC